MPERWYDEPAKRIWVWRRIGMDDGKRGMWVGRLTNEDSSVITTV